MNATTESATLIKAALRSAERLGLSDTLPDILGIDSHELLKITTGESALDPASDAWKDATTFVSLYRSLLTLLSSLDQARSWLTAPHHSLGGAPADLLRTAPGRELVFRYLDAVQKYEIKLVPPGKRH